MRNNTRVYRTLAPLRPHEPPQGELNFQYFNDSHGSTAYARDPRTRRAANYLPYVGNNGIFLFTTSQLHLLEVAFVRTNGTPALTGHYLAEMLPRLGMPRHTEHFVSAGDQMLSLTGNAKLEPGDNIGVASAPLLQVSLDAYETEESPLPSELTTEISIMFTVNASRPPRHHA